jgi:hypothetical protein
LPLELLLLFLSVVQLSIKLVYRWRTWRERGITVILLTVTLGALLFTGFGDAVCAELNRAIAGDAGALFVPVFAVLGGLLGMNPFLFALLVGAAQPDRQLALYIVLPMALGNMPQTVFLICTMPPRE